MSHATFDANAAARFLDVLAPGELVTFQTFDDTGRNRPRLIRILHGTVAEHAATLGELNALGAGAFFMVNAGDLQGRKATNVRRIRALFVDLDGAPLEPVQAAPLAPHAVVETSPNRWHAYWRVSDCPLADFTPLQKALASRFTGDKSVNDLARVMRLPGFDHRKQGRFRSHLIALCDNAPYTLAQFRAAFALDTVVALPAPKGRTRKQLPDRIPEGERNATLFSLGRGFVQNGIDAAGVNHRLQKINAERCDPPLCATEVDTIAENASRYPANGFAGFPRALGFSPEWKALSSAARTVAMFAYCRDNGDDDCAFALTQNDFNRWAGFRGTHTLPNAIAELLTCGILVQVSEPRNAQAGRIPAMYAIASKWKLRQLLKEQYAPTAKRAVLHRKQYREGVVSAGAGARSNPERAA